MTFYPPFHSVILRLSLLSIPFFDEVQSREQTQPRRKSRMQDRQASIVPMRLSPIRMGYQTIKSVPIHYLHVAIQL